MSLRIYLTGRIEIEVDGVLADLRPLPGHQGRRALAYLVCARDRPVSREELADAIWEQALPPAWDTALRAIVSRLRRLCTNLGRSEPTTISSDFGCYQLHLPPVAWVDVEASVSAIGQAEAALRTGAVQDAWGHALVAAVIAERPFLPGEEGAWIEQRRAELHRIRVRALECVADLRLAIGEGPLAVEAATEAIRLEPFRETSYQRLMRAHAALGNRAEALRTYERCRRLLADELGADPSAEIEALYLELLRG
jgi:DNA-binding SARP family transcriptional activator